jgi:hypothetical protein
MVDMAMEYKGIVNQDFVASSFAGTKTTGAGIKTQSVEWKATSILHVDQAMYKQDTGE